MSWALGFLGTHGRVKTEVDQVVAGRYDKLIYVGSVAILTQPMLSPHLPNSLTKLPHPHPIHHHRPRSPDPRLHSLVLPFEPVVCAESPDPRFTGETPHLMPGPRRQARAETGGLLLDHGPWAPAQSPNGRPSRKIDECSFSCRYPHGLKSTESIQ